MAKPLSLGAQAGTCGVKVRGPGRDGRQNEKSRSQGLTPAEQLFIKALG